MRAKRIDSNHGEIRDGLRKAGYKCYDTHDAGLGFPDLCVVAPGCVILLEVKQVGERLTGEYEPMFHAHAEAIAAPVFVVRSVEEALTRIGEVMRGK